MASSYDDDSDIGMDLGSYFPNVADNRLRYSMISDSDTSNPSSGSEEESFKQYISYAPDNLVKSSGSHPAPVASLIGNVKVHQPSNGSTSQQNQAKSWIAASSMPMRTAKRSTLHPQPVFLTPSNLSKTVTKSATPVNLKATHIPTVSSTGKTTPRPLVPSDSKIHPKPWSSAPSLSYQSRAGPTKLSETGTRMPSRLTYSPYVNLTPSKPTLLSNSGKSPSVLSNPKATLPTTVSSSIPHRTEKANTSGTSKQTWTGDDGVTIVIETQDATFDENESTYTVKSPLSSFKPSFDNKKQTSMNSFLGLPDHGPPQYFYLQLEKDQSPCATFTDVKPKHVEFTADMYWKDLHRTLTICSNVKNEYRPLHASTNSGKTIYKKSAIPLLKSHLQKNIRKCQQLLAVKTARELLVLDPLALLRRIPIIMFEDTVSHFDLPVLIWLMCAVSKGFQLNRELCKWILGLVDWLGLSRIKDPIPNEPVSLDKRPFRMVNLDTKQVSELPDAYKAFLFSIGLRISFGGTRGDMRMLSNALDVWYNRFISFSVTSSKPLERILKEMRDPLPFAESDGLGTLKPGEWDLTAIDFHVSNIIDRWKVKLNPNAHQHIVECIEGTEDTIEDVLTHIMWQHGSNVNNKTHIIVDPHASASNSKWPEERWHSRVYSEHKTDLFSIARHILQKHYIMNEE